MLAIIRDVTKRKGAEEAVRQLNKDLENRVKERTSQLEATIAELESIQKELRQSEERFRLLVEGARDYAIFMLGPEGRIVSWNEGAERIHGYVVSEAVGEHFSVFYAEEDIERGLPGEQLRLAATEGRFEEEGFRVRQVQEGRIGVRLDFLTEACQKNIITVKRLLTQVGRGGRTVAGPPGRPKLVGERLTRVIIRSLRAQVS